MRREAFVLWQELPGLSSCFRFRRTLMGPGDLLLHFSAMNPLPDMRIPRVVVWMALLSFVLQVAAIGAFRQYHMRAEDDHYGFGWEMGRVARSIAQGNGFSSPYGGDTGPTSYEPPLYPFLIAGVFRVFGIYSTASAWVLLTINSIFSAATCIPVYLIARRVFDESVALWSARVWAFLPYVWYWAIHWIWDTTFTPLVLSLIVLLTLEMQDRPGWRGWWLFGGLWGIAALANPSTMAFLPPSGLWLWWRRRGNSMPSLGGMVLASAVFVVVLAPWLVRNYAVFGDFVFIRGDAGLQLRLGNGPSADGMWMSYLPPSANKLELEKYQQLGELGYNAECKRLAFDWIRANPGRFAVISAKRVFYYWNGVPRPSDSRALWDFRDSAFLASSVLALWGLARALRQKRPGAWLLAWLVLTYPAIYYLVFAHARYRHPIEPELFMLGVFLVAQVDWQRPWAVGRR